MDRCCRLPVAGAVHGPAGCRADTGDTPADYEASRPVRTHCASRECASAGAARVRPRPGAALAERRTDGAGAEAHAHAGDEAAAVSGIARGQQLSELPPLPDAGPVRTRVR